MTKKEKIEEEVFRGESWHLLRAALDCCFSHKLTKRKKETIVLNESLNQKQTKNY